MIINDESGEPYPANWEEAELNQIRLEASRSFRDNLIWNERMWAFAAGSAKEPRFERVTTIGLPTDDQ